MRNRESERGKARKNVKRQAWEKTSCRQLGEWEEKHVWKTRKAAGQGHK